MQEILRKLSPRVELIVINLICFGPFAIASIVDLVAHETVLLYDDQRLYTIAAIEIVAGSLAVLILRARGWTLGDLGVRVTMLQTIGGVALYIVATVLIASTYQLFSTLTNTDASAATTPIAKATWPALILLLAIDPLYEETFEVAYNMRATERDGAAFGISLSATIRLICHLYQGPIAPLTILPLGIIFALVYWRWRRVWPLAVAHGVAGFFALAPR